jgi:hypothetical protein
MTIGLPDNLSKSKESLQVDRPSLSGAFEMLIHITQNLQHVQLLPLNV